MIQNQLPLTRCPLSARKGTNIIFNKCNIRMVRDWLISALNFISFNRNYWYISSYLLLNFFSILFQPKTTQIATKGKLRILPTLPISSCHFLCVLIINNVMIMRMVLTLFKVICFILILFSLQEKFPRYHLKCQMLLNCRLVLLSLVMPGTNLLFLPTIFNHYVNGIQFCVCLISNCCPFGFRMIFI